MSRYFIDRPIFAWVIALVLMLMGVLAIRQLPIAQFPSVAPPSVAITATYPGADATTLERTTTQIIEFQNQVRQVLIDDKLFHYIAAIINETRMNSSLYLGASPRASIAVMNCAKASAAMKSRDFVIPDDVVEMVPHVLRHRIMLTPEKEMEGIKTDDVIAQIIKMIEVPR